MERLRHAWFLCLFVVVAGLPGCINLSKPYPDIHWYSLEALRDGEPELPTKGAILHISRLRIAPGFESKEFVYRVADTEYQSDYYHQWFVLPHHMLTTLTHQWITTSNMFEHVLSNPSRIEPTHILEGSVSAWYGDFRDDLNPQAVLEFHIVLIRDDRDRPALLFKQTYQERVLLSEPAPVGLVEGFNRGFKRVLNNLEADVLAVLLEHKA